MSYDGPDKGVDASWTSDLSDVTVGSENGETVDVPGDCHKGAEITEGEPDLSGGEWPEDATPREELNADQIAVIEALAEGGAKSFNSISELSREAADEKNRSYAHQVLTKHWPRGKEQLNADTHNPSNKKIDDEEIETLRRRALNGEDGTSLADEYGVTKEAVLERLKGERGDDSTSKISPLQHDREDGWVRQDRPNQGEGSGPVRDARDYVDEVRQRLLAGESTIQVAQDFNNDKSQVWALATANKGFSDAEADTPPVKYADGNWQTVDEPQSANGCVDQQQLTDCTADEGDPHTTTDQEAEYGDDVLADVLLLVALLQHLYQKYLGGDQQ